MSHCAESAAQVFVCLLPACSFYLGHVADIVAIQKESGTEADPLIALTQKWYELYINSLTNYYALTVPQEQGSW